jgi:glycosyltransferase involved in cell wall biosynthesis
MKIAFFNHTLRLGSGIDNVITELASRLSRRDDVTVYCFKNEYSRAQYDFQITEIKSVFSSTKERMSVIAPFLLDKVGKLTRSLEENDVVNTHNFPANFLARNLRKPLKVVTDWSVGDPNLWPSSLKQRLYVKYLVYPGNKVAARKADVLLVSSEFIRRWMNEHYSINPTILQLNGINFELLDKNRVKPDPVFNHFPSLERKKIVLYVGRITDHKNIHTLIEAFDILVKRLSDVMLVLVGDYYNYKEYHLRLLTLIQQKKLQDKIIFTGVVPREELPCYYSACSIYATCTLWEGFLRAEYFAFEKPIVCFDTGPNAETVVDGENGYLVEPLNIKAFSDKMHQILDDEILAKKMGKQGYLWAKKYLDFDIITDNFRSVCERAFLEKRETINHR